MSDEHAVYGRRPVLELLTHRKSIIKRIILSRNLSHDPKLSQALSEANIPTERLEPHRLDELSGGGVHQGVIAIVRGNTGMELHALLDLSLSESGKGLLVTLDQVTDPQNIGAVLRLCEAVGVDGLILPERRTSPITPAVRKVSVGASELVPTSIVKNLDRTLRECKKRGFWIFGADATPSASSLFATDFPRPLCIVLGAEGDGLRRLTVEQCDALVRIPMEGVLASLNVSQAAAVILYEILRQREKGRK